MKSKEKTSKRGLKIVLIVIAALLVLALVCGWMMFREEFEIIGSMKKIDGSPAYYMEVNSDYHFDEFLAKGGVSSDTELSGFLTEKISKGFYKVDSVSSELACSTISAETAEGAHTWGRNFDWNGSVPIIVKCTPAEGYASISTCDFQNITGDGTVPEDIPTKMLSIAAYYVPMDGINSAGLCVADLEVNEGGMPQVNTDKADLTITTAIRLLLNKAATVNEAVALLKQYDIHASGSISHHLSISDISGAAVSVEFTENGIEVVDTKAVTNFNLAVGDTAAGGESAQERYETLCRLYEENNGVLSREQVRHALEAVCKTEGEWTTQWSIVYDSATAAVDYYFGADYSAPISFTVPD